MSIGIFWIFSCTFAVEHCNLPHRLNVAVIDWIHSWMRRWRDRWSIPGEANWSVFVLKASWVEPLNLSVINFHFQLWGATTIDGFVSGADLIQCTIIGEIDAIIKFWEIPKSVRNKLESGYRVTRNVNSRRALAHVQAKRDDFYLTWKTIGNKSTYWRLSYASCINNK